MSQPKRIVAALYEEVVDERGNLSLRKVTTTQWLTVKYIADTLGLAEQTMYRKIVDDGAMPHSRFGVSIRVKAADFMEYLRGCELAEYERPEAKERIQNPEFRIQNTEMEVAP